MVQISWTSFVRFCDSFTIHDIDSVHSSCEQSISRGLTTQRPRVAGADQVIAHLNPSTGRGDDASNSTILVAGVDTTSGSLARILHTLATHPDAQGQLKAELVEARSKYGERIPYDALMQLPYLDAVCRRHSACKRCCRGEMFFPDLPESGTRQCMVLCESE